jgi:fatty-acyl-CoA synthase
MSRSYASGVASKPLIGETIGDNLERAVARFGEREALVVRHQDVRLTYAELDERVDALARGLLGAGLRKGDRVGIWAPNRAEWVLVQFATAKAGIILVNVNPAYRTTELEYALRQSGCRMLIAARAFKTSDYAAMIDEVRADLPDLEQVVLLDSAEWERLTAGDGPDPDPTELDCDDAINIQYTSGTTGFPKGATLSHHNILNNGYFVGEGCGYDETDRVCIPVPFYHCFGMVMGNLGCVTHGSSPRPCSPPSRRSAARASTACRRCSSPSSATRASTSSTCPRCAPGSWPARRARSRS